MSSLREVIDAVSTGSLALASALEEAHRLGEEPAAIRTELDEILREVDHSRGRAPERELAASEVLVAAAHQIEDRELLAGVYFALGRSRLMASRPDEAEGPLAAAERHLRDAADRPKLAAVLGTQAHLCLVRGDPETALGLFRESHAIAKELGDGATQARSGCGLGECYTRLGRIDQARQALREAIEVTRALGERGDEFNAWRLLARSYDAREDPEGLAQVLASCAVAADAEGIPLDERLRVRAELANAYVRGGRFHEAERPYREGLQLARQSASRQWEGYFAGNLGSALVEMGRPAEARELLSLSLEVAKAEGDEEGARIAQHNLAVLEEAAAPADPDSSAPDNEAGGS